MRKIPDGKILIYDIETTSHKTEEAEMRFFGYYSYKTQQREIIEIKNHDTINEVKYLLDTHDILVGFNNKKFDNIILNKYGLDFRGRTIVDLWDMIAPKSSGGKGRHAIMKGFTPTNYKLGTIVKYLGLGKKKNEGFDYKLLSKKTPYTPEELDHIVSYTEEDITITRNLFEYLYNYFYTFSEYLNEEDNKRLKWLTTSVGAYAYKVICKEANLPEKYADEEGAQKAYEGGYVALPTREKAVGSIRCKDVKSAYPHAFIQANLYSHSCNCCTLEEKYTGKGIFKLQGAYCSKELGSIEKVIRKFYNLRLQYKKDKDPREYTIKIVINTLYGISGSPIFESIYNINTASDCTYIVREMIKYAREQFSTAGYEVLYTDTDSCYVFDPFNDDARLNKVQDELVAYLKSCFPFPQDTFGMDTEAEIKAMFFFKSGDEFAKKNYMYITTDKKTKEDIIVIKGLPIIKSNATALGLKVYNKFLKTQIIKRLDCKFNKEYLTQLFHEELKQDISLAGQIYKVKELGSYKNPTSLPAKISQYMEDRFKLSGLEKPDTILLIPNHKINLGVRMDNSGSRLKKGYCTIEDFKNNKLTVYDINIDKTTAELEPFIREQQQTLLEAT